MFIVLLFLDRELLENILQEVLRIKEKVYQIDTQLKKKDVSTEDTDADPLLMEPAVSITQLQNIEKEIKNEIFHIQLVGNAILLLMSILRFLLF